jgi:lipoate-protein ligase B
LIGYVEAFAIQTAFHERLKRNDGPGTILFQEYSHIITCRRRVSAENLLVSHEILLQQGVAVRKTTFRAW